MLQHLIRYYLNLHVSHTPSGITYRHVTVTFARPCPQRYVLLSPTQILSITKTKVLLNFHSDITNKSFHIIFAPSVSIHWHSDIPICPAIIPKSVACYPCSPQTRGYYLDVVVHGRPNPTYQWKAGFEASAASVLFLIKSWFLFYGTLSGFLCSYVLCHHLDRTNADPLDPRSRNELSRSSEFSGSAEWCPQVIKALIPIRCLSHSPTPTVSS